MGAERGGGPIVCHDVLINGVYDGYVRTLWQGAPDGKRLVMARIGSGRSAWGTFPQHGPEPCLAP